MMAGPQRVPGKARIVPCGRVMASAAAFTVGALCAAVPQDPQARIEKAWSAAIAQAAGDEVRCFVAAISDGDDFLVESWPRPVGDRTARIGLLANTRIANQLVLAHLRQADGVDAAELASIEVPVLVATAEGIHTQPTRFSLDALASGEIDLVSFYGPAARAASLRDDSFEPFLIAPVARYLPTFASAIPGELLRRRLEGVSGLDWAGLLAAVLGPPAREGAKLGDARRFLEDTVDAARAGIELEPGRLAYTGLIHVDALEIDARQARELLERVRTVVAAAHAAGGGDPLSLTRDEPSEFLWSYADHGIEEAHLAVRADGACAFLLFALSFNRVGRIARAVESELWSKQPEPQAPRRAVGLGGGRPWPRVQPAWSKQRYSGELRFGGQPQRFELQLVGTQLTVWVGPEREQVQVELRQLELDAMEISMDARLAWLPTDCRVGLEERAVCDVHLRLEGPALVGGAVLRDSASFRASACVPGVIHLVPTR